MLSRRQVSTSVDCEFQLYFGPYVDGYRRRAPRLPRLGYSVQTSLEEGVYCLAVVVLARWNPFLAIAAALLFGSAQALQFEVYNLGPLSRVPSDVVLMFPYIATIIAVMIAGASRILPLADPWIPTRRRMT